MTLYLLFHQSHKLSTSVIYCDDFSAPRFDHQVDWDTFEGAVLDEVRWLKSPIPTDIAVSHLASHAMVIRKLFPMLPFNAFQVINEEASQRIEQSKKGGG